jgi:phage terminase large subunit-like protein
MKGKPADNEPYPDSIQKIQRRPYGSAGFRAFSKILGLKIHPFQSFMLGFYFTGVTELVILISKKNGKTTLLAALALYHLLMTKQAECVIGASSRDQATILFNQAAKLIEDADLERHALPGDRREPTRYAGVFEVRSGYRVIKFEQGRIRVLAADADTADGVIPTLAIVDELHRHPSGALYGVFRDGLLGDARMVTISTAGASMDSPLGELLTRARDYDVETVKRRSTYSSPDGSFVLVEWALADVDDFHNMRTVKTVNPAPWHTPTTLKRRHDSPSMSPGQWLRFACGIWTEGDEPPITPDDWDRLRDDGFQTVKDGDQVILVPSVGHDAAIGIAVKRDDRVAVRAEFIEVREGRSILADTEDALVNLCDRYRVLEIRHPVGAFLRSADLLAERLRMKRVPLVEDPHSPTRLTAATGTFDRLMRSGNLIHDGDLELRKHCLAALRKTTETGERYMISERSRGQVAVMMAVHAVTAYEPTPKPKIHAYQGA